MARMVKVHEKRTKEGPFFSLLLYDERGRFVLEARTQLLSAYIGEQIDEYLRTGRRAWFTQAACRFSKTVASA